MLTKNDELLFARKRKVRALRSGKKEEADYWTSEIKRLNKDGLTVLWVSDEEMPPEMLDELTIVTGGCKVIQVTMNGYFDTYKILCTVTKNSADIVCGDFNVAEIQQWYYDNTYGNTLPLLVWTGCHWAEVHDISISVLDTEY